MFKNYLKIVLSITSNQIRCFIKTQLLLTIALLICNGSCNAQQSTYHYITPSSLNDGLQVASAKSVGIKENDLEKLAQRIMNGDLGYLRAIVLIKDGNLFYEGYFHGARLEDRYTIYSVSKTFTSALIGIAIDKGFIKSVDQAVLPFFPEYQNLIHDPIKKDLHIHHLLTLSSGFDWDESTYSYEDRRNIHVQMEMTSDWIQFILRRPMKSKPGERWKYNTGNVQLLSAIIKKSTGLYLHEFAEKYLFNHLKIKDNYWNTDPSGYTCAGGSDGGLRLKTRDIAKLGCLYTNNGIWKGKRIISQAWIEKSTRGYITTRNQAQYGYLWHVRVDNTYEKPLKYYYHSGSGGHILMVHPDLNLVIVVNSCLNNIGPIIRTVLDMTIKNKNKL